jgi:hypothetical protein
MWLRSEESHFTRFDLSERESLAILPVLLASIAYGAVC